MQNITIFAFYVILRRTNQSDHILPKLRKLCSGNTENTTLSAKHCILLNIILVVSSYSCQ